ncbi:MAG: hypothetical protein O3A49_05925 [Candidatus Marinimicrobia bacterium]|nr:hypothetical protein [Candidatus Neomarinimicrobiota bacterium]
MNIEYCKEVDWLPEVPEEFRYTDREYIRNNLLGYINDIIRAYNAFKGPDKLYKFYKDYLPFDFTIGYQIVQGEQKIHRDNKIKNVDPKFWENYHDKFLYLLTDDQGVTQWWDDDEHPTKLLYEKIIPKHSWHQIKVVQPHIVTNLKKAIRIAVVIRQKKL